MHSTPPRPPGKPLTRLRGGRLVVSRPDRRPIASQIANNEQHRCDVAGCGYQRQGLGRWCRKHTAHRRLTGHPTAPSIRIGRWRSYVLESSRFVDQQLRAEHPSVGAGVQWCADELLGRRVVARRADDWRPHTGYSRALARMRSYGVSPQDMLARAIAAHFAQECEAGLFKDDGHWRHQSARLFLYARPMGPSGYIQRERDEPMRGAVLIGPRVRMLVFERSNAALGVLSARAAQTLMQRVNTRWAAALPSCVAGERLPFAEPRPIPIAHQSPPTTT
jgi:hypothetical protein